MSTPEQLYALIAHAEWSTGRADSLARLMGRQLDGFGIEVVRSRQREHASTWASRIWNRAKHSLRHVVILNDDVVLGEGFASTVLSAIRALPDEPISLHSSNPNLVDVGGAWARCYHYSGPGVIMPPGAIMDLLDYSHSLPWSFVSRVNEDVIASLWAWDRQRPFWYLLPSPLTHDLTVPSTLGYDNHPNRIPVIHGGPERDLVIWNRDEVPFVELPWGHTDALAYRRHVLRSGKHLCCMCLAREGEVGAHATGTVLCRSCLALCAESAQREYWR